MGEPVYFRPPDYLYCVRSVPAYYWWAGTLRDGSQLLFSLRAVFFDPSGNVVSVGGRDAYPFPAAWLPPGRSGAPPPGALPSGVEANPRWVRRLGFAEGPIRVRRFFLPDVQVGVADLPASLAEFVLAPERASPGGRERAEMRRQADEWLRDGLFCFHCGGGECYMEPDGRVVASPA